MDHRLYLISLYDIYGELLTNKQQEYFEDYYFNNLTLSEISENYNVTRTAIHNQLKESEEKLEHFESVLKIKQKNELIKEYIENIDEEIKKKINDLL